MAIEISCSNCGEDYNVKDEAAGKAFRCKVCGTSIRIPSDEEDTAPRRKSRKNANSGKSRRRVDRRVTLGPAIGLYVVASMGLAYGIFMTIKTSLDTSGTGGWQAPMHMDPGERLGHFLGAFSVTVGMIVFNLLVLIGAYCLHTYANYTIAMFGCVVASVPCCSPCFVLGIPFGIWGLAVLTDDQVKGLFDG